MRAIPLKLWALTICSAALQIVPFPMAGPVPLWRRAFCWFCLAPLLLAVLGKDRSGNPLRPAQAALLGYVAGVTWYAANCYWIYQTMYLYGGIPKLPSVGILILFSLYLGLYPSAFAWLIAKLRMGSSLAITLSAVPFLWVAIELARARITGFPWDLLGYTQVDNSALTALAPIGGVMLLSFVIAAVNSLFAAAFIATTARRRLILAVSAVVVAAILQAGSFYRPAADAATHSAVLLQENLSVGAASRLEAPMSEQEKFRVFGELSRNPVGATGARQDLIVWPEAPADFNTSDPVFNADLSALARSTDTPVIAGTLGIDLDPNAERGYHAFGSAAVFDRDGTSLGRYDKIHRVPWGEYVPYKDLFSFAGKLIANAGDLEAGTRHTLFALNGQQVGIFICYESIFGDEIRTFVKDGANVLVNISDDGWYGDTGAPWQHLDMARMRAIENRRWVLRDTNTGVTTAIDPHGRGVFSTPRHVRQAFAFAFDYSSELTFYTLHGDWFAWLCALIAVGFLAFAQNRLRFARRVTGQGKVN
jgi:apolipoprotein N-acyltransferase